MPGSLTSIGSFGGGDLPPSKKFRPNDVSFFVFQLQNPDLPDFHDWNHPFWEKLKQFKQRMLERFPPRQDPNQEFRTFTREKRLEKAAELKAIIDTALERHDSGKGTNLQIIDRSSNDNIVYDPIRGVLLQPKSNWKRVSLNRERVKRFLTVALHVYELLKSGKVRTKRDIYYLDQGIYNGQEMSDHVIDEIATTLGIPRALTNIVASSSGVLFGDLEFTTAKGGIYNCLNPDGIDTIVPSNPGNIVSMKTDKAKFLLVIEKEATYRELLLRDKVHKELDCILITGKGYPDVATRHMVHLIYHFLKIPVLCLVDCDPHGLDIMCMYRYGSISMAYDNHNLATPAMRWVGMCPSDMYRYEVTRKSELSESDWKKLDEIKQRQYIQINEKICREINLFMERGEKAELSAFMDKHTHFLGAVYLQELVATGSFI